MRIKIGSVVALFLFLFTSACVSETSTLEDAGSPTGDVSQADVGVDTFEPDVSTDAGDTSDPDSGTTLPDKPWPVTEPGPYNVGYRSRDIVYQPDGPFEERTLRLAIWYPTLDKEGEVALYFDAFRREEAIVDAEVAVDEPMPLLVFSHGNSSLAEQSYFMTEFFASHGWVVAAPDHTGNTFSDTQGGIDLTTASVRPQDMSAVIDFMLDLPADHPLSGRIDDGTIAATGHSFGAYTTLALAGVGFAVDELKAECESGQLQSEFCDTVTDEDQLQLFRDGFLDSRIGVAIPQAPGGADAFRDGVAEITMPTLLMTGGMDRTLPNSQEGDPIWNGMRGGQHLRLDIERAGHFTFSNMCDLLGSVEQVKNDGCGDEFIEADLAYQMINAYSLAYARYYLLNDSSVKDLLNGERMPFPEEELELDRK